MATYDLLSEHGLDHLLASGGIDHSVRTSIINYLMMDGLLTGPGDKVSVQEENKPPGNYPPLNPNTEVLYLTSPSDFVATDPNLKVIVDTGDAYLTVAGSNDVLVATGNGVNLIDMAGTSGNDEVIAGGSNTISGGRGQGDDHGHHDSLWGDGGNYSTMGGGNDGWPRGGEDPKGDDRHDNLWGDGGNYSTMGGGNDGWPRGGEDPKGGHGNDNLWGDGGYGTMGGGTDGSHDGAGTTTTIISGTGNDTLISGSENTLFEVGRQGNDVIEGGGGSDKVQFDDSLAHADINIVGGVTTVDFKDTGQTITVTGVQELEFTGHHDVTIK